MYNPGAVRVMSARQAYRSGSPGGRGVISIGVHRLTKDLRHRDQSGEVAAWWHEILVPAGDYEITTNGYYAFVRLEGVITSAYTPSLYGGVAIGSQPQYEEHSSVGRASSYTKQPYLYNAAELLADPSSNWIPHANVEPVLTGWCEHKWSNDRYASPFFGLIIH